MTRERAKELAPIIAAYGEGKAVQYSETPERENSWLTMHEPAFDGRDLYYRIKPEPKPKKRPMTREEVLGFLANTQGIVCRINQEAWVLPGDFNFDYGHCVCYQWATIDKHGNIGTPNAFEVEE